MPRLATYNMTSPTQGQDTSPPSDIGAAGVFTFSGSAGAAWISTLNAAQVLTAESTQKMFGN